MIVTVSNEAPALSTHRPLLIAPAVLVAAVLPNLPSLLWGDFQGDDFGNVWLLSRTPWHETLRFFISDWNRGIWGPGYTQIRPLFPLCFKLDLSIWATNPVGFHGTNLLLHALNALLVYRICRNLPKTCPSTALLAAVLFALSPATSESVSWISGRTDLLMAFFALASVALFLQFLATGFRLAYATSLFCFALALFSKESSILLPLILLALLWAMGKERFRWGHWKNALFLLPLFLFSVLYLLLRALVFGPAATMPFSASAAAAFALRSPLFAAAVFFPVELLSLRVPKVARIGLLLLALAAISWIMYEAVRRWRDPRSGATLRYVLVLGPIWYLCFLLPTLVTGYTAFRYLYLPAVGSCILLALLTAELKPSYPRLVGGGLALLLALNAAGVFALSWRWAEAGAISRSLREGFVSVSKDIPAGSTILFPGPAKRETYLWTWALPYALQPPFSDTHARFTIIEGPELYCCPNWWAAKEQNINTALRGQRPLFVVYWEEHRQQLQKTPLAKGALDRIYKEATGKDLEASPITETDLLRLFQILISGTYGTATRPG